jgi:diguanylate cyclase (GGDEF)-like protein
MHRARGRRPAGRSTDVVEEGAVARAEDRLSALADAGRALSVVRDAEHLIDAATERALHVVGADAASWSILDHAHGCLRTLRNVGALAAWEKERPEDEHYVLADYAHASKLLQAVRPWCGSVDDPDLPPEERRLLEDLDKRSALSVPLLLGERVWGELYLTRTAAHPAFSDDDVATADAFAALASAALTHLEGRDALHTMAYRDALTGLGNRREVDDRLEEVFAAEVLGRPIALILADVNDLKVINDTYGHAAGDQVLREVADILAVEAGQHPGAIAARIGGDEFCLLLDGVEPATIEGLVDRVSAAASRIERGQGVSCGWAVASRRPGRAPTAGAAGRALLRLADAAQYRTKRDGHQHAQVDDHEHEPPGGWSARVDRDLAAQVVEGLRGLGGVVERLEHVARTSAVSLDAASWWVSVQQPRDRMTVVRHGYARMGDQGPDATRLTNGAAFPLAEYPASAAALEGGCFDATLASGDEAEREYLAAYGYSEIVGAGSRGHGHGWLVELCGDALAAPLAPRRVTLWLLVELAVHGANRVGVLDPEAGSDVAALSAPSGAR